MFTLEFENEVGDAVRFHPTKNVLKCRNCGKIIDRDLNGALNILYKMQCQLSGEEMDPVFDRPQRAND